MNTDDILSAIDRQAAELERCKREILDLRQHLVPSRKRKRRVLGRVFIAMACAAAALFVSGSVFASIPDAGGVVHGCYTTSGGERVLFLIDTALTPTCPLGQTPISWNQTGPTGATGATGPSGVVTTGSWTGPVGTILALSPINFIGSTATVTVGTGQRLTASSSVGLGTSAGTADLTIGICYQLASGGTIFYLTHRAVNATVTTTQLTYAASQSSTPGDPAPGSYHIGMCAANFSLTAVSNTSPALGWVIVTNS
jgi:hypothetical protein